MTLTITPVKFNNYSATQNYRKNNNQNQNFEGLPVRVFCHPEEGRDILNSVRKRDIIVDRFTAKLEEVAQQIGINTNKMDEQGYSVEFIPKFAFSSKMSAILKNKEQNIVQCSDRAPLMIDIRRGTELNQAEEFAYMLKDAHLDRN